MDSTRHHRNVTRSLRWLLQLASLIFSLALPAWFWDQGEIETEATTHSRQYTARDGRTLAQRVLDPHANDLGTYQARELSYLIDLGDAFAYAPLAALLGPGFVIPLSAMLASSFCVIAFFMVAKRASNYLRHIDTTLLLLCFLTSFCFVSTMGVYYRSSKPMLTAVVLAYCASVLKACDSRRRDGRARRFSWTSFFTVLGLTLVGGLLDRQGVYLGFMALALLAVSYRQGAPVTDVLAGTVGMSRPLLKFGGGSVEILRDVLH